MRTVLLALMLSVPLVACGDKTDAASSGDAAEESEALTIEETGVASFDDFFGKVGDLMDKLNEATTGINTANANLTAALNLTDGTPLADALADLKAKAEGKIKIAMNGTMPELSVADGTPEDVTAGIAAVNGLVEGMGNAVKALKHVVTEAPKLVTEAKTLPAKVAEEANAGNIKPTEVLKVTKKVKNNVKATAALPGAAKNLTESCTATIKTVADAFGGGE